LSKPTKPGELRNVSVEAISLVSKAANRQTFKIFKSAKADDAPQEEAPATVTKDERGLFHVLKMFFSGEEVAKGDVEDKFRASEKSRRFYVAIDALQSTIGYSRYGENNTPETDPAKIKSALKDFNKILNEILLGNDDDVKKFAEEIRKSGRKIAGARLSELKSAYSALGKIIEETDGSEDSEGDGAEVKKEEIGKIVKEALEEAVTPLKERLDALEKSEGEESAPPGGEGGEGTQEQDFAELVKSAVAEAVKPLSDRLEKVEKTRGVSNRIPEGENVQKGEDDTWGDLL